MNIEQFENLLVPPKQIQKIKKPFEISTLGEALGLYHLRKIQGFSVMCPHCNRQTWPTTTIGAAKCSAIRDCGKIIPDSYKLYSIKFSSKMNFGNQEYFFDEE